jgi:hypothetical protein
MLLLLSFEPLLLSIKDTAARVTIVHNMHVSYRVMEDPTKSYDPAASVVMDQITVEQPYDFCDVQNRFSGRRGLMSYRPSSSTRIRNVAVIVKLVLKGMTISSK